jgi:hypothetical protein
LDNSGCRGLGPCHARGQPQPPTARNWRPERSLGNEGGRQREWTSVALPRCKKSKARPQQQWQNTLSQTKVLETKQNHHRVSSRYAFRHEMCPPQPKSNHMYKGAPPPGACPPPYVVPNTGVPHRKAEFRTGQIGIASKHVPSPELNAQMHRKRRRVRVRRVHKDRTTPPLPSTWHAPHVAVVQNNTQCVP